MAWGEGTRGPRTPPRGRPVSLAFPWVVPSATPPFGPALQGFHSYPSSQAASVTPLLKSRRRPPIDTFARPRDTKRLTASPRPDPRVISYRGHQPSFILYYVRDDFLISASDGPFTFLAISMLAPGPPPSASLPILPDVRKHLLPSASPGGRASVTHSADSVLFGATVRYPHLTEPRESTPFFAEESENPYLTQGCPVKVYLRVYTGQEPRIMC